MNNRLFIRVPCLIILIIIVLAVPSVRAGEEGIKPVTIGHGFTLISEVLGEERGILVYLPPGYDRSTATYPVIYLLDGDNHFHHATGIVDFLARNRRIPPAVVVALPNTDRTRDLTPYAVENRPTSGGADTFLRFFEKELMPHVEKQYRVSSYRILVGHSLGGLFATHALLTHPDLFDAFIAVSPWYIYDEGRILDVAVRVLERRGTLKKRFYMTVGQEGEDLLASLKTFSDMLRTTKPEGLIWRYVILREEDHGSVPHRSIYLGLEFFFSEMRLPDDLTILGLAGLERHYRKVEKIYGLDGTIPENVINLLGYQYLGADDVAKAIEVFESNVERYPESANVYDSLGEAQERSGDLSRARANYARAVKRGKAIDDPNLRIYRANLQRVLEALSSGQGEERIQRNPDRRGRVFQETS